MGFRIFAHAIGLVFRNLTQSLRISGILYLMSSGVGILVASTLPTDRTPLHVAILILATAFETIATIWIAVAFHRYILLDEMPDAIVPRFDGRRIFDYFVRLLQIVLVGVVAGMVFAGILGVAAVLHAAILGLPLGIVFVLVLVVASHRLGIILPASSVEKPLRLREAWAATRGATWSILAVTLLSLLAVVVLELPVTLLLALHLSLGADILGAVVAWIALMFGVAVLTTLYGHYVEGRSIA